LQRGISKPAQRYRRNDEDRAQWIANYEPLYLWQRNSKMGLRKFIRVHRSEIDGIIDRELGQEPVS